MCDPPMSDNCNVNEACASITYVRCWRPAARERARYAQVTCSLPLLEVPVISALRSVPLEWLDTLQQSKLCSVDHGYHPAE